MKRILLSVLSLLVVSGLFASDFDVRRYGAKGDGLRKDTKAIQKAIDACGKAGGGRVVLSGGTFLSGAIQLRSGVELHIDGTACLKASPDIADFPEWQQVRHVISENLPRGNRNASFIFADEAVHIAITGDGTIDGNGTYHVREAAEAIKGRWFYERIYPAEQSLPRMVFLAGCSDVLLEDVTMVNQPAGWGYWIHDCERVTIRALKIYSDVRYPNNDGIHLNCSRDVTVSDCRIETGDDAIVLRANSRSLPTPRPTEHVVVTNCVLRSNASGIRIGWTGDGTIRNCVLSNLVIHDSYLGISIHIPDRKDGQLDYGDEATRIEQLHFSDIRMERLDSYPILAVMGEDRRMRIEAIQEISFSQIHATARRYPQFKGRKETPFRHFTFNGCTFVKTYESHHPESFQHTQDFVFDACRFSMETE